jgi:large subunit ribosomal protein L10
MPNKAKVQEFDRLSNLFQSDKVFFLADYRGMTVDEMEDLRNKLRPSGIFVRVAKNRIMIKAWEAQGNDDVKEHLKDPTALIHTAEDPVSPAKALKDFIKGNEKDLPKIKAIVFDNEVYPAEKLNAFTEMASPQELRGMVVNALASPLIGFVQVLDAMPGKLVYALGGIQSKLVYAIQAIHDKKNAE